MQLTGPWDQTKHRLSGAAYRAMITSAFEEAATKEAHRLRTIMIDCFPKGGPSGAKWKPLSVFTQLVARAKGKGRRNTLEDYGDLRNSHAVARIDRGVIFVGVRANALGRDGKSLVNLAIIHNFGTRQYTVTVTEKMRKFFWWLHFATGGSISPLKPSTTHITVKIPARPWMQPIWNAEKDTAAKNIADAVATRWFATMVPR